jgi:L-cysteine/cystine lyase
MHDAFPALRGVAYLNAGSSGPMPAAAGDAMREEVAAQVERPRIGLPAYERLLANRERARAAAARAVGAEPADVVLTGSTSMGIGLAMAGLPWAAGDRAITTTEEHPGVLAPLDQLARRFGVAVQKVDADDVVSAIDEGTTVVALSHVLWTTGRVLPLAEIAEAAHAVGALVVVDGAQSAGNIAVDAPGSGADVYAFSGQKWLLGPIGSGGLWVHPRMAGRLAPALPSYFTYGEDGVGGELRAGAARFDPGSIDPVTLAGFAAALEWVEGRPGGRAAWLAAAAERAEAARALLAGVDGVRIADPGGGRSGLIALEVGGDPAPVAAGLAERGVLVRFIPGTPYLRASVGAWTSDDDLTRLADGLAALLA